MGGGGFKEREAGKSVRNTQWEKRDAGEERRGRCKRMRLEQEAERER